MIVPTRLSPLSIGTASIVRIRVSVTRSVFIIGIGLNVRQLHRSPLEGSARRDACSAQGDRVGIYEFHDLGSDVVCRAACSTSPSNRKMNPRLASQSLAALWISVSSTALQIEGRAADDLEHIGGGGLLLQGFAQLIEQPRILDGNDSLRREVCHQLDLLVSERPNLLPIDNDGANQFAFLEHRHAEDRPNPTKFDRCDDDRIAFDITS